MKFLFAAAALVSMAAAAPALAQPAAPQVGGYVDLGAGDLHEDGINLGVVTGRVGARAKYFGAEGEASVGFTKDNYAGVDLREKDQFAGYAVGFLPVGGQGAELFARVGYGHIAVRGDYAGYGATVGEDSVNYGVGAQYFFHNGPNGVRIEATRYDYTGHDAGSDEVYSLSYVRRFGGH
jgi:hypothetical protein